MVLQALSEQCLYSPKDHEVNGMLNKHICAFFLTLRKAVESVRKELFVKKSELKKRAASCNKIVTEVVPNKVASNQSEASHANRSVNDVMG